MAYRVFDNRTDETLFKNDDLLECNKFVEDNYAVDGDDWVHIYCGEDV